MKLADFPFVNPRIIWDLRRLEVISVSCQLIFLLVCSLMQPPPAHPDTAADILCQKWKIAPARDGKIRKDCHDMHVVFWVKIRGTKSLKEFLLSAFIELSSEQRLNSPVAFETLRQFLYASRNVVHIVYQNQHRSCANSRTICHIHCIVQRKLSLLKNQNVVKKQNSNWKGCRGPFQTCFASGIVCQLNFISVPLTKMQVNKKSLRPNSLRFWIWASERLTSLF